LPEASVTAVALTGPLTVTHQFWRPGHGDASTNTWPSIDAVPPAGPELTQPPPDVDGEDDGDVDGEDDGDVVGDTDGLGVPPPGPLLVV